MRRINEKIAVLSGWTILNVNGNFYIPYTHYTYLEYLNERYEEVYVLAMVKDSVNSLKQPSLSNLKNVKIIELLYSESYIKSIFKINDYYKAIKRINSNVDLFYCRVPDPFCWMPKLVFNQKCKMHFVGDTIDVAMNNKGWSIFKKFFMILGYLPEYFLTLVAAKRSEVFSNGKTISEKLKKINISVKPLISSTIKDDELLPLEQKDIENQKVFKFVFTGYLRKAKGVHTLLEIITLLEREKINYSFDIIGDGELYNEVEKFIINNHLNNKVILHGRIENRMQMNEIYRNSDFYIFTSLSEGSPRSVLEAMAQGLVVVSTPVGSLPSTFNLEEISFAEFENADSFMLKIKELINNNLYNNLREKAYDKVKNNYTLNNFLDKIFYEI